ncbi:FAD-dependent oxidoreductase [Psychrobacter sp. M13]|uniref:FAD-dependent oxidoreductase n=1 Tax=Psychrobacter sp. M13 TaxID=3067275 RepID=UPI00273B6FD9|nr:bifunctional TVP38/TMEM64 family protein/FAD-dependent oxidoreductase [Psychrobacter sp. M13]WLP93776.1 FAD-dependent oxidoreductase [Psychrobacter sp. M13]
MKKVLIVLVVVLVVAGFFLFGFNDLLTLEGIQARLGQFYEWRNESPLLVGGLFFLAYVLIAAFSLPGAALMTLLAGALFGLWWGLLLASFASSVGALFAFLAARYLLRESFQSKFASKLDSINAGIEKDGGFYLFTLRLLPLFPFFLVNILMGLTNIKTWTYYWVSQIGMLAGTFVYVNAGVQLAQIESLGDIISPTLLASFALLAVFPLIAKKALNWYKARQVYKGWSKPKSFDRNMVVIGAGAAGLVSSYIAATVKAKVTLVEAHKMGGDCLNYGCVPSKSLIKSAKVANSMRHGEKYGLQNVEAEYDFKSVMARIHKIIATIEPNDSVERYTDLGVDVIKGYATIIDPWTIEIASNDANDTNSTQRVSTRSIVIAAGSKPFIPPIEGLENIDYLTSDNLWEKLSHQSSPPKRLVIVGGGPIGCELSQAFARLGSQVTQVQRGEQLLNKEDLEVAEYAKACLEADGVRVLLEHDAVRCERVSTDIEADGQSSNRLTLKHNGIESAIEFDEIIIAVGRQSRLTGYGLDNLGIDAEKTIVTNDYLETKFPNILAAGDVAGPYQFTHVAAHQAWYAAVNALFGTFKKFKADYRVIPWVTFIDPEVARVGLNEIDANKKNIKYEVTRYDISDLDRAITESQATGWVKVLTVPNKDKILGVTIVGNHAGELLAEYVLAMKHNLGLNKVLGTIHTYPTMSEANKYVAGEWKRNHAPEKLLTWVEKFHKFKRS